MAESLYFYKLVSEYPEDVTKNCKLTINEVDHDLKTLKDYDIKTAEFVRNDKTLVLTRNNGEKLIVPLRDVTYNLEVDAECGESGTTLTISYDCVEGKKTVTIANILTADNLMDIIGSDILTKVITDGTLKGNGTMTSPLGIAGVEKTGSLAPALEVFDLTKGGKLPDVAKLGTRYVTKEYVNDYGYLYNGAGVAKIQQKLKNAYVSENSKENERYAWRVPSKADWDALLNSIEPCEYQNHGSSKCHVELGKYAGKYLKSECGWLMQPDCSCTITKPNTGCSTADEDYIDPIDPESEVPAYNPTSPIGVDKYGMGILPAGVATLDTYGRPQASGYKEQAVFWTTTHVHGDEDQDVYSKIFDWNKGGVMQVAECPKPYYSVRLVKDYDGSNYYDSEYIDGILYKTILFPESGQIWLASNYCDKEGFVEYEEGGETPEILEVNNGEVIEKRVEMFINEWNGYYWEKRIMHEGETIVIENPCFDQGTGTTTNVCWTDKDNVPHCIEVEIPKAAQSNIEYRVFTADEGCDKVLVNTDDLVVERVVNIIVPMIQQEREERIEADEILSGAIETEREERISADTEIREEIDQLREEMESATTEIWEALAEEAQVRAAADEELNEKIDAEIERAQEAEQDLRDALNQEILDRIDGDARLDAKIDAEIARATQAEELLDQKIDAETARAKEEEVRLDQKIDDETARAEGEEARIEAKLDEEIERATEREDEIDGQLIDWRLPKNPFTMTAAVGKDKNNLVLDSKDSEEHPEHSIKINFDGSFGKI